MKDAPRCLWLTLILTLLALPMAAHAVPSGNRDGTWSSFGPPQPGSIPSARLAYGMALDSQRHRMIVFGGTPGALNDVWALSLDAPETWTQLTPNNSGPSARYGCSMVYDATGDRLIVFGGYDGAFRNDVWALSLSNDNNLHWSSLSPGAGPSPRGYGASVYDPVRRRLLLFGGASNAGFFNDTWALSLSGSPAWTQLAATGPAPGVRDLMDGVYDSARDRFVVFGGWSGSGYYNDTWALSLGGAPAWSPVAASTPPTARRESAVLYDAARDRMVIIGGFTGFNLSDPAAHLGDTWALDFASSSWTQLAPETLPMTGRFNMKAAYDAARDRAVIFGGYGRNDGRLTYIGQTLAFALGDHLWTELAAGPIAPSVRREYAASLDPDAREYLVFSGTLPAGNDRETWRLSLDQDPPTWERLMLPVAPHARHGAATAWDATRGRMLMFGGYDDESLVYSNELWQFANRPSPAWTALATTGPGPSGRMQLGMVYDPVRDRLLVFGGHPTYLNDLWELPLAGADALQWHALTPGGTPPSPRWGFSMVYDPNGDRAIVFGGNDGSAQQDTWSLELSGGTPTWVPIAEQGDQPPARYVHTAIMDSDLNRMVLYGGGNTGGEFLRDTWELRLGTRPMWKKLRPDGLSPGERDLMTAAFDGAGRRLVFFGGFHENPRVFYNDTWFLTWTPDASPNLSLPEPTWDGDRATITWSAGSGVDPSSATVYRRGEDGAWTALGSPADLGGGRLGVLDPNATPGAVYFYRVGIQGDFGESFSPESRLVVPAAPRFALSALEPNPAPGAFTVAFALSAASAAQLTVVDVTGRTVLSREVGSLGAGSHRVELGRSARLPAGLYFVRLQQGARAATRRLTVLR